MEVTRKQSMPNFPKKKRVCAYSGVRNVRFFGKFSMQNFLVTSILRFDFLSYYRRITDTSVRILCNFYFQYPEAASGDVL